MPETKKTSRPSASKSKKSSRRKTAKAKAPKSANGAKASKGAKAASQPSNGAGPASSVKETVKSGAHEAATLASKAKVPLVATGATIAGVAGAVVLSRNGKSDKVLGVKLPKSGKLGLPKMRSGPKVQMPSSKELKHDARKISSAVADAAKQADQFGQRLSQVASSVQKVGETTEDAVKKS